MNKNLQDIKPVNPADVQNDIEKLLKENITQQEKKDKINQLFNVGKSNVLAQVVLNQDRSNIVNLILESTKNQIISDPSSKKKITVEESRGGDDVTYTFKINDDNAVKISKADQMVLMR